MTFPADMKSSYGNLPGRGLLQFKDARVFTRAECSSESGVDPIQFSSGSTPNHQPKRKMRGSQTFATSTTVSNLLSSGTLIGDFFSKFSKQATCIPDLREGVGSTFIFPHRYVAASKLVIKSFKALLYPEIQTVRFSNTLANLLHDAAKLYIISLDLPAPRAYQHCFIRFFLLQLPILWRNKYQSCMLNRFLTH